MRHSDRFVLVSQLVFGVDTTSAITLCALLGWAFGVHPTTTTGIAYLAIAGFANYFPDLDLLIYLPFQKRFGWESHWSVGHHPAIVLPLVGWATWVGANGVDPEHVAYLTTLVVMCTTMHFVRDSMDVHGMQWLSPFNRKLFIKLDRWQPRVISDRVFHEYQAKLKSGDESLVALSEPVTSNQFIGWLVAVGMFCLWVLL